jgi:hypothetical protein
MTTRAELRSLLAEGRYGLSLGRVKDAVGLVKAQPRLAAHLVGLMFDEDPGVSQRAADVLERVTARGTVPGYARALGRATAKASDRAAAKEGNGIVEAATIERILARNKDTILGLLVEAGAETHPKKLRWNLALMLGRLPLTVADCRRAAPVLYSWLDDASSLVKTAALQGLTEMTQIDPASVPAVVDLLRIHSRSGTAAMRARSRILLTRLEARPRSTRQLPKRLPG